MKSLLFVTVLALMAVFDGVKAWSSCRREINQYISQNLNCAEGGVQIHSFLAKLGKGEMTYDELAEKIDTVCQKINSTSCYSHISTPIAGSCNEVEDIQHFRNALKSVISFNEYMCQNNGEKLLDFVKNDGAVCFSKDERETCYNDRYKEKANNVSKQRMFTNANVCYVVNSDLECLYFLENCENQNVHAFYQEILSSWREKFSC